MANLTETSTWESGIYQLETVDPVIGGPTGVSNTQAKQLAARTRYLRDRAVRTYATLTEANADLVAGMSAVDQVVCLAPFIEEPLKQVWTHDTASSVVAIQAGAEAVYVAFGESLRRLDRDDGSEVWTVVPATPASVIDVAAPGPRLFVLLGGRVLKELDPVDGSEVWTATLGGAGTAKALASDGRTLYALIQNGNSADVYAYDCNGPAGDGERWAETVAGTEGIWTDICTDGRRVVIVGAGNDGTHALLASDGSVAWSIAETQDGWACEADQEAVYTAGAYGLKKLAPLDGAEIVTGAGASVALACDGRTLFRSSSADIKTVDRTSLAALDSHTHGASVACLDTDGEALYLGGAAAGAVTVRRVSLESSGRLFRITAGSEPGRRPLHKTFVPI